MSDSERILVAVNGEGVTTLEALEALQHDLRLLGVLQKRNGQADDEGDVVIVEGVTAP